MRLKPQERAGLERGVEREQGSGSGHREHRFKKQRKKRGLREMEKEKEHYERRRSSR